MNEREYNDTERLNYILKHGTISSNYTTPRKYDRAMIDTFIEADETYEAAAEKKLDKQREQAQAYREAHHND